MIRLKNYSVSLLIHQHYTSTFTFYMLISSEKIYKWTEELSAFTNQQNRKYSYLKYCINVSWSFDSKRWQSQARVMCKDIKQTDVRASHLLTPWLGLLALISPLNMIRPLQDDVRLLISKLELWVVQTTGHHCCHAARQLQHVAVFNVKTLYPCPKLLKTIKSEKTTPRWKCWKLFCHKKKSCLGPNAD